MIFKVATLLLILLCVSSRNNGVVASLPGEEEELQILKKSDNVKTIQLESGDIVDCVDIYKQPAFSHPLLKNHKILVLPKSYLARREKQLQELRLKGKACPHGTVAIPRTTNQESEMARALNPTTISAANNNSPPQVLPKSYLPRRKKQLQELRLKGKACPLETVPIPRTTKQESEIARALNPSTVSAANNNGPPHLVFLSLEKFETLITYHGASGEVIVYNTSVNLNNKEMAQANIWMQSGPNDELNYIIVGLGVGVSHNDINPRLFTFWSNNGGESGCYNLQCGFIQIDSEIAPGHLFTHTSKYDGRTVDVKIKIFQDKATSNWLLSVLDEEIVVGYFPPKYFPYLKSGAQTVAWGGAAYIGNDGNSPPMGSGYVPDGIYNHAAYFRKLTYFDNQWVLREPSTGTRLFHHSEKGHCYGFRNGTAQGQFWGSNFFFGGPGGQKCGKN